MNGVLNLSMMGRFGNQCFQYCFARAYAEKHNMALRMDPWDGEKIFEIQHERITEAYPERNENDLNENGEFEGWSHFTYRSYSMQQKCLIYTRSQVKQWLRFRPEIADAMGVLIPETLLAHRRVGDYLGYGYPVVAEHSYSLACRAFGLDPARMKFVTEESQTRLPGPWPDFVPDFWRLVHAKTLLRGNSSFSWWAATLGDGLVLSPVIEGQPGGEERDYPFVAGNAPRFNTAPFLTDLHLTP